MKRRNGFSMIELLVAMTILLIIVSVATSMLIQAQNTASAIGQQANTQENLRAGMHFLVRDLMQAGEGIPPAGISIPNTAAGVSAIIRPVVGGAFPGNPTALPAIVPGFGWGPLATTVNTTNGAVLTGGATDTITVFYADNSLVSSAPCPSGIPCPLNSYPVTQAAPAAPVCTGAIVASGATVRLDPTCFTLPGTPTPIQKGDLIMFHNINGTALEFVTDVTPPTITFSAVGDPSGLNGNLQPNGTVAAIAAAGTPTVITRVWMVTYAINTATDQRKPQLIRQVNYPNFPAGAPNYPVQQVADSIEDLNFTYDLINSTAPAGTYPLGPGDAPTPIAPDTSFQIRAVNILLAGRSEYPLVSGSSLKYFHNNLSTQVSIRSQAFVNGFRTSPFGP